MSNKALTYVWDEAPYEGSRLLVLLAIADFADDDGVCFPGVTRLAKKARLTPRALQKHLAILEQDGWLKRQLNKGVETGRGKTNRYTIVPMFNRSGEQQNIPRKTRDELGDTSTGVLWDIPTGESASSPKPSVEPSVEPKKAPATQSASSRKAKKATTPNSVLHPMMESIVDALQWDRSIISKTNWDAIRTAAKQLIEIGVALDEVVHLKRECDARQFRGYTAMAFTKVAPDVLPRIRMASQSIALTDIAVSTANPHAPARLQALD